MDTRHFSTMLALALLIAGCQSTPAECDCTDGADGIDGADGAAGERGPAGPRGPDGPAGPQGADGAPGSAIVRDDVYGVTAHTALGMDVIGEAIALCDDANDVALSGGCTYDQPGIDSTADVPELDGARAGWRCAGQNRSGYPAGIGATVVCLSR